MGTFKFADHKLTSWREIIKVAEYCIQSDWVFRGHGAIDWPLQTSLERDYGTPLGGIIEPDLLTHFIRSAPGLIPTNLLPADDDVAAWLGLIQHYGGPTRLLDVTRSLYVALFFAFESPGTQDRAVWAIRSMWCAQACAGIMAAIEDISREQAVTRILHSQAQMVFSLVHGKPHPDKDFSTFRSFTGVFPIEPWKPEPRQGAQQALFLCAADAEESFLNNLASHDDQSEDNAVRLVIPGSLRPEVLQQLSVLNINAGTLFPDLGGLARSLRTAEVVVPRERPGMPPWKRIGEAKRRPSKRKAFRRAGKNANS